ncbi:hypothetical protein H0177_10695 [Bacillus cereus]|uniref:hypothetical protein n=1 Tax=Bacillus cereus group TaxID=86661 RepID=UPI0011EF554B|nr:MULTISPECIES: hypothetical protein [Bacillus cereus group]KAA0755215.1 hypothetical protein DN401_15910 [Bacillus sp. BF2-3]MBY0130741.1 hypothetical protein [Bacillus cereus]
MKLKADLFPYPVLNSEMNDYENSEFSSDIHFEKVSPSKMSVTVKFKLNDAMLERFIIEGKAVYAVHLEGVSSSYRKLFTASKLQNELTISLNANEISGKIEVNTMILANEMIENYSNPNFNNEYYGDNFNVLKLIKGDILAFDTMAELNIKFANKENPNAKSMIRVAAINDVFMDVNIDGDIILVNLPQKAHEAYQVMSRSDQVKQSMLLVTIVLPALTYVIERVKNGDFNRDCLWVPALFELLSKAGYDEQTILTADAMKVAQQLLDAPVEDALYNFYKGAELTYD